ncbi:uncharacterized protein Triagg1_3809 [Trichoderma aggressivum f. europaeum]|uniref:Uncharacterized protein n=1 Tax=Trichoderma aggressivum f. europaeum TaxID=173218 RepID=A0AAE1IEU1_9HYPO|nr:hypothetical protein Triagg1_3809 [Trichoderma aggressivum f. europaeum]
MICPRWTPRATATLANLGDCSRQCSSRHALRPSKEAGSRPRRGFSTIGGSSGDGSSDSPPRETLQFLKNAQRTPPRHTAASTSASTSNPLPRRRTWTPAASLADAAGLDRRPRNQPKTGEARRPRVGGRDQGGSSGGVEDEPQDTPRLEWPQLQRRARGGKQYGHAWDSGVTTPKNPFSRRQSIQNPRGTKESSLVMLVIDGMSPNLNAADFYRITPNDLSDWQSVIKKVQQQRKVDTLEPLGRYWVTFSSGEAAASYRDRLVRLHKLNGFKLRSASGLWESSVPSSLKVSLAAPSAAAAAAETSDALTSDTRSTETLVDLVNTFTIAPGSQALLPIQRRKVSLLRPWTNRLAGLVENLGYGERPPTLMVDIYPPTLSAQELHQFIRQDGQNRGLRWQVSLPQHLKTSGSQRGWAKTNRTREGSWNDEVDELEGEDKRRNPFFWRNDRETLEKLKGRFILACADETEARRFQQSWNRRTLTTLQPEPARYLVHASIIKW